jgi:hypothetical protein
MVGSSSDKGTTMVLELRPEKLIGWLAAKGKLTEYPKFASPADFNAVLAMFLKDHSLEQAATVQLKGGYDSMVSYKGRWSVSVTGNGDSLLSVCRLLQDHFGGAPQQQSREKSFFWSIIWWLIRSVLCSYIIPSI